MKYILAIIAIFALTTCEAEPTPTEVEATSKLEGFAAEYNDYVKSVEGRYTDIANVLIANGVPNQYIELKPKDKCVIVYTTPGQYLVVKGPDTAYEAIQFYKRKLPKTN